VAVPERTADQRRLAAARAVAARRVRAEVATALKRGERTLADVLEQADHEQAVGAMRVRSLLESLPRFGPLRADRTMTRLDIAPTRRIRGLGVRQRAGLLAAVGQRGHR
jgi:hypothetical protein